MAIFTESARVEERYCHATAEIQIVQHRAAISAITELLLAD